MTDEKRSGRRAVDRDVYPRPEYTFPKVRTGLTYKDSQADFPPREVAPAHAPNVVVVLLDDVGYGWPSVCGGLVRMPAAERLAGDGLQYCSFHTTALCSPTRAALLTGRNHHTVSSGVIAEMATGFPGYTGILPKSCAMIAEVLEQNAYSTGWWGKNHNVPDNMTTPAGPFHNWPTQQGFDYFYGFIGGETDQFAPALFRGTTAVDPVGKPEDGYHLTTDLADDCIGWMRTQKTIAPDRPFFIHFAPGAVHAPHQPPLAWRGRNAGRFAMGWDRYREEVHERQLQMGVVPPGTKLTPRPDEIPAWESFGPDERRLFERQAENFADFLEHTDYEVGRLVDALQALGEFENTLFLYILGDNGSSAEGTPVGAINEFACLNGIQPPIESMMERIDELGLPGTAPHYAVGWAWAGDTPFQWTKQIASHFGGTRNAMIATWPAWIADRGAKRFQFHHVIDVVPTILEVTGISEPTMVNGVPQKPIEGVSMAYTFDRENASAPSTRTTQYFEMFGNRAIYHDGWMASCRHGRLPWVGSGDFDFAADRWELYNVEDDFSQADDLAAQHPERLRQLQDLFLVEAATHDVLPLDDRASERIDTTLRPGFFFGRNRFSFHPGMVRLPEGSGPKTNNVKHSIAVTAEIPQGGADGVLVCLGGDTAGWSLYLDGGWLRYHYNWFALERYEIASSGPVPPGRHELRMDFEPESPVPGSPANVRLFVDGQEVGAGRIDKQVPGRFGTESYDVGMDTLTPVAASYAARSPFAFTGRIERVDFEIEEGAPVQPQDRLAQHLAMD